MKHPSTMSTDDLISQLAQASAGLRRCRCGSRVVMAYEPGCTFIRCLAERKTVSALPDWQPKELAEAWNQGITLPEP